MPDTNRNYSRYFALGVWLIGATAIACSNPISPDMQSPQAMMPTAPAGTGVTQPATATRELSQRDGLDIGFVGNLSVELNSGTLVGDYAGIAEAYLRGRDKAVFEANVSGTGDFRGYEGTLSGTVNGAFVDEGVFNIRLSGTLTRSEESMDIRVSARGLTTQGCSEASETIIEATANGVAGPWGAATIGLSHETANPQCF